MREKVFQQKRGGEIKEKPIVKPIDEQEIPSIFLQTLYCLPPHNRKARGEK